MKEVDVEQALAQADELRAELERGRPELANVEEARRQVESSLAGLAERERVVSEREAQVEAPAQAVAGEREEQEKTAAEQHAAEAVERPRGLGRERPISRRASSGSRTPSRQPPSERPKRWSRQRASRQG